MRWRPLAPTYTQEVISRQRALGTAADPLFPGDGADVHPPQWLCIGGRVIFALDFQGGGKFNGAMLEASLVDEISQIIVPVGPFSNRFR